MKQNSFAANLIKAFVAVVIMSVLVLAAFGAGLSIGAQDAARLAVASQAAQVPAASQGAAALPPPGVQTPTLPSLPFRPVVPTPTPVVPASIVPTVTFTYTGSSGNVLDDALFNEAWGLLQDQFYGDLPQGKEVTYDAIRGVVDRLGDPHTAFVDPKSAEMFNTDIQGSFEGIGAQVEQADGGGVRLRYLFPDQPAAKSGLQAGDVILAVDGKDITPLSLTDAISLIRGPRGSKVTLTIRRGEDKPFDIAVVRDRIEIPVVTTKTLADGKIEYVSLSEFSSVAPTRLSDAINAALDKKPTGLILDLRGNPGGLLDAAVRIGSYFVPQGSILIERSKDGTEKVYERQGRYLLGDTPLVVLVDGGSASASEIVAGAIQDAGTGVLIGDTTYGKGSVQLPNTLSDGSQLRITIAHWFTPKDRGIDGTGLQPDVKVSLTQEDVTAGKDPQLDRAVQYLLDKSAK